MVRLNSPNKQTTTTPDIVPQYNASSNNNEQSRDGRDRSRDRSRDREVINNIFSQSAMSLDELSNSHSMGVPSRTNSLDLGRRDSRLVRSTDTLNLDGSLRIHEIDLDSQEILDKIKSLTKRVKKLERNKHSGTFESLFGTLLLYCRFNYFQIKKIFIPQLKKQVNK